MALGILMVAKKKRNGTLLERPSKEVKRKQKKAQSPAEEVRALKSVERKKMAVSKPVKWRAKSASEIETAFFFLRAKWQSGRELDSVLFLFVFLRTVVRDTLGSFFVCLIRNG